MSGTPPNRESCLYSHSWQTETVYQVYRILKVLALTVFAIPILVTINTLRKKAGFLTSFYRIYDCTVVWYESPNQSG